MISLVPRMLALLLVLMLLLAASLCVGDAVAQDDGVTRPNIVWLSAEDLSPRLGAYGDPLARTPNLDRLARRGTRFDNAFVSMPICAPSRTAIITGMYQNTIGAHHMRTSEAGADDLPGPYEAVPPHYVKAFPEYLRAAGYYTTNNAKTDYQFGLPFTIWDESSRTAHWRNRPDADQPFFSVFNFMGTHESFVWPHHEHNQERALVTDPSDVDVPPYYPDTQPVRESLARHYDNIAELDTWVGAILGQLEEDGLLENTIVFFWGDHGDGLPRMKRWLYDSGLKVPLIVLWPGATEPGSVNEELVSLIDLAPQVLTMAGLDVPRHMHGRVFMGPEKEPEPAYLFATRDRVDVVYDMARSVRDRRYKYIRNFHTELPYVLHVPYRNQTPIMQEILRLHAEGQLGETQRLWLRDDRPPEELYDTTADPHEIRNLAEGPDHLSTLLAMRAALDAWMHEIGDQGRVPENEMVADMWPNGVQPVTPTPFIVPRRSTERQLSRPEEVIVDAPAEIAIYVPTQDASVGYTTDPSPGAAWKIYTGPIRIEDTVTIRARAIRYGYRESDEAALRVVVR